jgi:hypothetical protein
MRRKEYLIQKKRKEKEIYLIGLGKSLDYVVVSSRMEGICAFERAFPLQSRHKRPRCGLER